MSAAGITPPSTPKKVERRWSRLPWGIEIQTWRLVETRTLPAESASLPLSSLFDDDAELGAVPCAHSDQADTLESPPGDDITRENVASACVNYETEES
jgi:hypothetical protein